MVFRNETVVLILAFAAGLAAAAIAAYFILRPLFQSRKGLSSEETSGDPSVKKEKVEFVIDTFSSLINKLKEKENALERLRTQAETRASAAESYNEDILRCVGSGVISFNMNRVITTFNQAAEKILRRKSEDVLGLSCEDAFGRENILCSLLNKSLSSGEPVSRQEVELQRMKTSDIWVGLSLSPLKDRDGKQAGIIIVFTDLTEIKLLREQGELKKRLAMLGEMSGGIAHEFRNSMGTILGYVKILSKQIQDDQASRDVISTIVSEINAMDLVIRELLSYGKPITPSLSPVDLSSLIRNALQATLGRFTDLKVDVEMNLSDVSSAYIDEVLMRQAIQNIIQNAIESMPDGGKLKIDVWRESRKDGGIFILISDSGLGISPEIMEKIFLPFYTTKSRGTGMGLALVHKIILAHGGNISVESKEGEGTTFRIYLPCLQY